MGLVTLHVVQVIAFIPIAEARRPAPPTIVLSIPTLAAGAGCPVQQNAGEFAGALARLLQGRLRIASGHRIDEGLQVFQEPGLVLGEGLPAPTGPS